MIDHDDSLGSDRRSIEEGWAADQDDARKDFTCSIVDGAVIVHLEPAIGGGYDLEGLTWGEPYASAGPGCPAVNALNCLWQFVPYEYSDELWPAMTPRIGDELPMNLAAWVATHFDEEIDSACCDQDSGGFGSEGIGLAGISIPVPMDLMSRLRVLKVMKP